jgi:hypothetical protein
MCLLCCCKLDDVSSVNITLNCQNDFEMSHQFHFWIWCQLVVGLAFADLQQQVVP